MTKRTPVLLISCCLAAFVLAVGSAAAQTTHNVGVNSISPTTLTSVANGDYIEFVAAEDRSYCCEIASSNTGAGIIFDGLWGTPGETPDYSMSGIQARGSWDPLTRSGLDWARTCVIVAKDYLAPAAIYDLPRLIVTHSNGSPITAQVDCQETTLYGGFNTFVTDFNFLELTNTSTGKITIQVVAFNSVSGATDPIIDQYIELDPNKRTDVDIHTAAGAGAYGPVIVMHNGTPGSLIAVLNQYNITSTSPSLQFAPVATVQFKTRKELGG